MVISIIGQSSFIGKELAKFFKNKHKIINVNIRKIDLTLNSNQIVELLVKSLDNSDYVINCCASLKPKTTNDFFVNSKLPVLLQKAVIRLKNKSRLIHLSTLNTLIKERKDNYSTSKKKGEQGLRKKNSIILRLPLIYNNKLNPKISGNLIIFHKYLDIEILPFYPMIYPGHIYQPILIDDLCEFINKLIKSKFLFRNYNLVGKKKLTLWQLFNDIAEKRKKKTIKINTLILSKIFSKFKHVRLIRNNDFLSQILSIDQTKLGNNKTIKV
tara:strand:+ start:456 stop:1265 length:810 start_codon:yes stop_codon:yes gene_type:complete